MADIINSERFETDVLTAPGPVLVDFFANWCGPCRMLAPTLEELESERSDVTFVKVDIDQSPDLAMKYGVMSIPTLILFRNGEPDATSVGLIPREELEELLAK